MRQMEKHEMIPFKDGALVLAGGRLWYLTKEEGWKWERVPEREKILAARQAEDMKELINEVYAEIAELLKLQPDSTETAHVR